MLRILCGYEHKLQLASRDISTCGPHQPYTSGNETAAHRPGDNCTAQGFGMQALTHVLYMPWHVVTSLSQTHVVAPQRCREFVSYRCTSAVHVFRRPGVCCECTAHACTGAAHTYAWLACVDVQAGQAVDAARGPHHRTVHHPDAASTVWWNRSPVAYTSHRRQPLSGEADARDMYTQHDRNTPGHLRLSEMQLLWCRCPAVIVDRAIAICLRLCTPGAPRCRSIDIDIAAEECLHAHPQRPTRILQMINRRRRNLTRCHTVRFACSWISLRVCVRPPLQLARASIEVDIDAVPCSCRVRTQGCVLGLVLAIDLSPLAARCLCSLRRAIATPVA